MSRPWRGIQALSMISRRCGQPGQRFGVFFPIAFINIKNNYRINCCPRCPQPDYNRKNVSTSRGSQRVGFGLPRQNARCPLTLPEVHPVFSMHRLRSAGVTLRSARWDHLKDAQAQVFSASGLPGVSACALR